VTPAPYPRALIVGLPTRHPLPFHAENVRNSLSTSFYQQFCSRIKSGLIRSLPHTMFPLSPLSFLPVSGRDSSLTTSGSPPSRVEIVLRELSADKKRMISSLPPFFSSRHLGQRTHHSTSPLFVFERRCRDCGASLARWAALAGGKEVSFGLPSFFSFFFFRILLVKWVRCWRRPFPPFSLVARKAENSWTTSSLFFPLQI